MTLRSLAFSLCLIVFGACSSDNDSPAATTSAALVASAETAGIAAGYAPVEDLVEAEIVHLTDGDSFDVVTDGREDTVRMLGINANEGDECFGPEAGDFLDELTDGSDISLELSDERDDFGRLLAYVWVDGQLVNDTMIRNGFALARDLSGHRYAAAFETAEAEAKSAGRGLWAPDACGAPTAAGIAIADLFPNAPGPDDENPNGEWVELENTSDVDADLTEWSVKDESTRHRYVFEPGFVLGAHARVRLFSGCGTDSSRELYWCEEGTSVWSNGGDTAFVLDPAGNIVDSESYSGSG